MSTRLQTTFAGSPLAKNTSYRSQILALDGLVTWFEAGESMTTVGGNVSVWESLSAESSQMLSGTSGNRPALENGVFGGAYPGVSYDGVNDNMAWTGDFDRSAAFSWMMIFKAPLPVSAAGYMVSTFQSLGVGTWLRLNNSNGKVEFSHGAPVIGAKLTPNAPMIVIGTSSVNHIRGRLNGEDMGVATTDNAGGTQGLKFGAANVVGATITLPAQFKQCSFMIFQRDILRDGATVALLEGYARDVFDVEVLR